MSSRAPLRILPVLLLVAAGAWAQPEVQGEESAAADDEVFFESVDVNVVNVQVFVTDKQGNPITGLTADDFEVYEDKRPVAISNFFAVEGSRLASSGTAEATADVAVERPPLPESLPLLPEEQRLYLVVYIDNFNIRPFNRNRVFRRLRQFLSQKVAKGDQVMLVSYDRSLHIRHPFTTSADAVAAALFDLETLSGHALHYDSDHRDTLREIDEAESISEASWRVTQFAESRYNDLSFALDGLKEVVESLAGIEGRKALLYVSDGLPMIPGEDLFHALHYKFQESSALSRMRDFDLSRDFQRLTDAANTNGVTFYTIDAAGLRVATSATAERDRYSSTPGMDTMVDSIRISNLQSPLLFMADRTGGTAIINTNDVGDGLARIAEDFGSYYSLGYGPGHSGDGRYHRIEVKLKDDRKGVRIRHRNGYRDKTLPARMADSTLSTMRFGFERNPLDIGLQMGQQTSHEEGNFLVDLVVEIPIEKVTLVPRREFHEGRVVLFVAAMDADGGVSPVQEQAVPIRIPEPQLDHARGEIFHYGLRLLMRPGDHRIGVGVRDEIGAGTSFISRTVRVGAG